MSFTFNSTFSVFTPSEAEHITGVSVALQRDWRRREIMPKRDGHARFDLHDLADMLTLKMCSDAGMSLESAKSWVPFVPAAIIMHALSRPGAIEGDDAEYFAMHGASYARSIALSRSRVIAGGDLIIWADGTSEVVSSATDAIPSATPEKLYGAVKVLVLEEIGHEFARRASPRSLVHIERRTSDTS
ncbi:MerR family transcriptional regulator [Methylosinus sp. PW1]|uniref:MerR family transcriptional regulator n=1 Tax=Methylosinus sp. PW1 TaxID=107636 RepID=UPI00056ABB38|nr:MerR family transcriptional regulator [Methylosinus sp. PW1]